MTVASAERPAAEGRPTQVTTESSNGKGLLRLDSVTKVFTTEEVETHALSGVHLEIQPGEFVILDQFVDRTRGRRDTFFDGPETHHIGAADPYCDRLRRACGHGSEHAERERQGGDADHPTHLWKR